MENLDLSISKKGIELLKKMIGQKLISMEHSKLKGSNLIYEKVLLTTTSGNYLIDNYVDWFDNFFSGPEDIPFLDLKELNTADNPFSGWSENSTEIQLINERIEDVLIVQDDGDIYKDDIYYQHMTSSEGIIFITNKAQYGFFKENMYLDEEVEFFKDEKDVLSKAKSLKEHYDIFGYPFSGKCKRSLISLKNKSVKEIDTVEEAGEIVKEEER